MANDRYHEFGQGIDEEETLRYGEAGNAQVDGPAILTFHPTSNGAPQMIK